MGAATAIRNAAWVVAWDRARACHVYLCDADVAFQGDTVTLAGHSFKGDVGSEIDGRERHVMPGLVDIHSHPASEPLRKGITDETRSYGFWHTSLYEYLTVFDADEEGYAAGLQVGLSELLLSGVTTLVDIWLPFDGWLDHLADSGVTVAHCPTVFLRRGIALRSLGDYIRAGVNMGIGTDTYPHNYLEEMRTVATTARIIAETVDDLETSDVLNAATVGGARALGREDIGGLAPGYEADLIPIDLITMPLTPSNHLRRQLVCSHPGMSFPRANLLQRGFGAAFCRTAHSISLRVTGG